MSIITVTSRITHRSLMNKSKSELASMYLELCDVNEKINRMADTYLKSYNEGRDALIEHLGLKPEQTDSESGSVTVFGLANALATERDDARRISAQANTAIQTAIAVRGCEFERAEAVKMGKIRTAINALYGGHGKGSTIWGWNQFDKGYAAAVTAALTVLDAAQEPKS